MSHFDQFTDFESFLTPNDFFILKITWKKILQNILSSHQNFEPKFCCGMVKQRNFLRVADLWFDARFVKYYPFSLPYHKQCLINNIRLKCLQIRQKVSDIFLTCSLQIVSFNLRGLLISSFWSCDSDFW